MQMVSKIYVNDVYTLKNVALTMSYLIYKYRL